MSKPNPISHLRAFFARLFTRNGEGGRVKLTLRGIWGRYLFGILTFAVFIGAGFGAYFMARQAVYWVETGTAADIDLRLSEQGHSWVEVTTDGLQVILSGEAPSEAARFRALSISGTVVEAARIIDDITVPAAQALTAPDFSIEILRNDAGISLIGLIPAATDRQALTRRIENIAGDRTVTDFTETADYPAPKDWSQALSYALIALERLENSKISVLPDRVVVEAISESLSDKQRLEEALARRTPDNLQTDVTITAPRPVITPFTLRFVMDETGPHFDACAADTNAALTQITQAARDAGVTGRILCPLGLGSPSPDWGQAASDAIKTLNDLGAGTISISDTDIALLGKAGTNQADFDRAVAALERALPPIFSLSAELPDPVIVEEGASPPIFTAQWHEDGTLIITGDISDQVALHTTEMMALASFQNADMTLTPTLRDDLPRSWSIRTFAGLAALGQLHSGELHITLDGFSIQGDSGQSDAGTLVSQVLVTHLGNGAEFDLDVEYRQDLDPIASLYEPEDCIARITAILQERKITFEPNSTNLDSDSRETVVQIADVLHQCRETAIEVAAYSDSQGREELNLNLSQARALSVLNALRGQRVAMKDLTAQGYGEANPIADNSTEEGREANRRIEFHLTPPDAQTSEPESEPTPTEEQEDTENGQN